MTSTVQLDNLEAARAWIAAVSEPLDPGSRYISELRAVVDACGDVAELEARLLLGCRGKRHAGAEVFERMSLADKLRANLVTAETSLFRFAEGELEASRAVIRARSKKLVRVLITPCSHGEEAFTMAAFLLGDGASFAIEAFDIQNALIDEARSGRLTFGFPVEYLETCGVVGPDVLERVSFRQGDAFDLPLDTDRVFDLVLCRNFIGYFVGERAAELTAKLVGRVAPGGRLFLDQFCLGKLPEVAETLAAGQMTRVDGHPVFAAGASVSG